MYFFISFFGFDQKKMHKKMHTEKKNKRAKLLPG